MSEDLGEQIWAGDLAGLKKAREVFQEAVKEARFTPHPDDRRRKLAGARVAFVSALSSYIEQFYSKGLKGKCVALWLGIEASLYSRLAMRWRPFNFLTSNELLILSSAFGNLPGPLGNKKKALACAEAGLDPDTNWTAEDHTIALLLIDKANWMKKLRMDHLEAFEFAKMAERLAMDIMAGPHTIQDVRQCSRVYRKLGVFWRKYTGEPEDLDYGKELLKRAEELAIESNTPDQERKIEHGRM